MLLDRHRAKCVARESLIQIIGIRPRAQTVVLCHGVFDVVHPGHLRHLLYAKSKADVLVCSVTSDRCADKKGPYRPHVPQDLRAANLALLDIVDYVVVCDAPEPSELILYLQPDFYAKGFEYSPDARDQALPETAVVASYGGEVLFTPGDVVYSSSALTASAAPDLRWEKLASLMEQAKVSLDDLRAIVGDMRHRRLHVLGDTIVDVLSHCEMVGWNGKTPTPSVRRDRREQFVGGAGIVAMHARAAGADVQFSTVVGHDALGEWAVAQLMGAGVHVSEVVDATRPTTVKEVVCVGDYRVLKIDTVDSSPLGPQASQLLLRQIVDYVAAEAVIFSDFRHGVFNARSIPALSASIPRGCLRIADSQVASRWGNISDFVGFDLITPNEREARFALGDQDSGVRPLAARLHETSRCRWLLMKMGARGLLGFGPADATFSLDSFSGPVRDAVGAGDAMLAYSTLSLLVRPSLAAAAILGSFAAGVECEYEGNIPITPERVLAKIDKAEKEIG